jgi:hypothetical protein
MIIIAMQEERQKSESTPKEEITEDNFFSDKRKVDAFFLCINFDGSSPRL